MSNEWLHIRNSTVEIGVVDGFEIRYDQSEKRFKSWVKGEILSATSQRSLEKLIKKVSETTFEKVINISSWRIAPPEIVKVVKRGKTFYAVRDGKLKPVKSYYLYQYDEKIFKELTKIAKQSAKISEDWDSKKGELTELRQW